METKVDEFLDAGKISKEKCNLSEIEGVLREAYIDLGEAKKTQEVGAHRATFFLSYMAMLRAGRALLLLKGYRPASCSQHKTIVEMTASLLGESQQKITAHLEMAKKKQDDLVHDTGALLSELEAHDTFHYALLLIRAIVKLVKLEDPQFHVAA